MPLETAAFISGLVSSNPASSDGLNQADDHLRLIKSTLIGSFPNIAGAVTASDTQLNSLLNQLLGTTSYAALLGTVAAPSYAFLGDPNTGMYSSAADTLCFSTGGVNALTIGPAHNAAFAGAVSATGPISGPGVTPVGSMVMWLTDTLPTGNGVWCWANGGTLSRTTLGGGKELFDLVGTTYGVGDGSTTFNVINMQEAVPVGKSTMGGAASPGLLASIAAGLKAALGGLFGTDTVTIARSSLPNVAPTFTGSAGTVNVTSSRGDVDFGITGSSTGGGQFGFNGVTTSGALASSGTFTPAGSVQSLNGGVTQTGTAVTQPSRAVNFIIRIA